MFGDSSDDAGSLSSRPDDTSQRNPSKEETSTDHQQDTSSPDTSTTASPPATPSAEDSPATPSAEDSPHHSNLTDEEDPMEEETAASSGQLSLLRDLLGHFQRNQGSGESMTSTADDMAGVGLADLVHQMAFAHIKDSMEANRDVPN